MRAGRAHVVIGVAALATAALIVTVAERRARTHVVQAAFHFEGVTFDAPELAARAGGPLTADERRLVEATARQEMTQAFAPWRIDITDAPAAHYRVRVVQSLGPRRGIGAMAAAESRVFGPLGGTGVVDFSTMAALAVGYAPPGTPRRALVAAVGRGIGRVAAHELAHQILPHANFHVSRDESSYDFAAANRPRQFFGSAHWDLAGPWLDAALGRRDPAAGAMP